MSLEDLDPQLRRALRRALLEHHPDLIEVWGQPSVNDSLSDVTFSTASARTRRFDPDDIDTTSDR